MDIQKSTHQYHSSITWVIISLMLFLRIIVYGVVVAINHNSELWANPVFEIGIYLLTALLIWWERDNLAEFFIDKLALILIIIGKPIELALRWLLIINFPPNHPIYFLLYIPISICIILVIIISRPKLPTLQWRNWIWILVALIVGIVAGVIDGYLLRFQVTRIAGKIYPSLFLLLPLQQLVLAAISEEPLFRGFLWGALRRSRWKDIWILFFQTGLFIIGHIYYFGSMPISFWIVVPTGGIVFGLLAWRSRSITTSITAHAFTNAIAQIVTFYRI
jgi:membrane protease YdiL (CAAX protease family)